MIKVYIFVLVVLLIPVVATFFLGYKNLFKLVSVIVVALLLVGGVPGAVKFATEAKSKAAETAEAEEYSYSGAGYINHSVHNDGEVDLSGYQKIPVAWAEAENYMHGKVMDYPVENTIDGNYATSWQDGVDGNGEGTLLSYYFEGEPKIVAIKITNGNQKSAEDYYQNGRPAEIAIIGADANDERGDFVERLPDDVGTYTITYNYDEGGAPRAYIYLTIYSVYEGSKYQDTCISEIEFYGYY